MSGYFDDLDNLLNESLAQKAERKAAKPSTVRTSDPSKRKGSKTPDPTKPANASWMNAKEVEEYHRQVKIAEAKGLWKPHAAVAMFSTQVCLCCGSTSTHFEGFFIHQKHKTVEAERWVKAPDMVSLKSLPKYRKHAMHEADACYVCISNQGYLEVAPIQSEPSYATWTPHKNRQVYSDELESAGGFGRKTGTPTLE